MERKIFKHLKNYEVFEKLEYTKRINEASISQLQDQFVDTGKIEPKIFDEIVDASGGKGAYATWLVKSVVGRETGKKGDELVKTIKEEDIYKFKEYLDIFTRFKNEFKYKDINRYDNAKDLEEFIKTSFDIANRIKEDPSMDKGVTKEDKYKDLIIGEVEGGTFYKLPRGRKDLYGASCELGSGTAWCTATGKDREQFDNYISKDDLYIWVKGDEKYQFHFADNQFMDKYDNPII